MNQPSATDLKRQLQALSDAIEAMEEAEGKSAPDNEMKPGRDQQTPALRPRRKSAGSNVTEMAVDRDTQSRGSSVVADTKTAAASSDNCAVEPELVSEELNDSVEGDDDDDSSDEGGSFTRRLGRIRPRSRRAKAVTVLVTLAVLAGGTSALLFGRSNSLPKGVAFQVSGHDVTETQLNAEASTLSALYGITAPTAAKALDTFRRDVAKAYAVSLIIDKQAKSRNIVIADKSAQDVLTRYVTQIFGTAADGYDKFVQALGGVGTSEAAVLTEIKRQLAIGQLYDQITGNVAVTDAQVSANFEKNKAKLSVPEKRDISNIVVATEAQAVQIKTQLAAGTSFTSLAVKDSLDTSTSKAGGTLGEVQSAQLDAAYARVAFAAASNKPFGPVQTQYGWNVGEVTKVVPAAPAVYSTIKAALKSQLLLAAQLEVWRTWLAKQIVAAHVRYSPTYEPADPNAAPTTGPGQVALPSTASPGAQGAASPPSGDPSVPATGATP